MNNGRFWIVTFILTIAIGVTVGLTLQQGTQIRSLTSTVASIPTPTVTTPVTATSTPSIEPVAFEMHDQEFYALDGGFDFAMFKHLCAGQLIPSLSMDNQTPSAKTQPYCLGKNTLVEVDRNSGAQVTVDDRFVTKTEDAPLFISFIAVPTRDAQGQPETNKTKAILMAYAADTCLTMADCGVGMPNKIGFVFYPQTQLTKALVNYPQSGIPVWNPSGTKAVYYPDNSSGAGSPHGPLIGYDLEKDRVTTALSLDAGYDAHGGPVFTVDGAPLPAWVSVDWSDDSTFNVLVRNVDGTTSEMAGSM